MTTSLWNPDNVRDVAESVGLGNLQKDVVNYIARDVDFRIAQVLEQAIRFMRHSKRTTLDTQHVSEALKVLGFEPLFGYESTRPLKFGETSLGPGQSIYYVDDEEIDLEKIINAPLPRVPREVSMTTHWLAIEGVQPSIPQNPTSTDSRSQELAPKGPHSTANSNLAALSGADNVSVKPQIKHVISSELQLYFGHITSAIVKPDQNDEVRSAAYNSLRSDQGLHQLVTYFVQFVADNVTHRYRDIFLMKQMLLLISALLSNKSLFIDLYIYPFIPSILTILTNNEMGSSSNNLSAVLEIRNVAASLVSEIVSHYSKTLTNLKLRLVRTLLKKFWNPNVSLGGTYGALIALHKVVGGAGVAEIILPNLKDHNVVLEEALASDDATKRSEADALISTLIQVIRSAARDLNLSGPSEPMTNGTSWTVLKEETRVRLAEKIGPVLGNKVAASKDVLSIKLVLDIEPLKDILAAD